MDIARAVNDWFVANRRDLPWRAPDFGAWGILVSEIMLQQTPVARVIPRLEQVLQRGPTPADPPASHPGDAARAWERRGPPATGLLLHATRGA